MNKKTIFLEVWRGAKAYLWSERLFTTVQQFKKEYNYTYVFMGKSAVVYTGTEDYELTRLSALKIATDHMKGNVVIVNVDLALCGSFPLRMRNKKTPRH